MRLIYVANSIIPSRTANSIHVMKMCSHFAELGYKVNLFIPNDYKERSANVFDLYDVPNQFKIVRYPYFRFKGSKYFFSLVLAIFFKFIKNKIVYSRDLYPGLFSAFLGNNTILECHNLTPAKNGLIGYIHRKSFSSKRMIKLVVISKYLKLDFQAKNICNNKIIVAPDGSDLMPPTIIKQSLDGNFKIGYVGHLYPGKGLELIFKIAPKIDNAKFHIIGGLQKDIEFWINQLMSDNIIFHGFVSYSKVFNYIAALDVCLLPNQKRVLVGGGSTDIGKYTSPLKMFDYMSAGKPIIASNLPVIREILNEKNAILCDHDQTDQWVRAIDKLRNDIEFRTKLGRQAKLDFEENYTWSKRASYILDNVVI